MIDDKKAVSIDRQGLVFRNQPLSDFATLDAIGVRDGAVIHLIMQGNAVPAPVPAREPASVSAPVSPNLVRMLSGRERQAAAVARQQERAAQAAAAQAERELAEAQRLIAEHRRAQEVRRID